SPIELPREKFNEFYLEYSLKNKAYFKFDSFLKVPQDSSIDTLKKIGSFLSSICNLKCTPHPNLNDMELIYCSGVYAVKTAKNTEGFHEGRKRWGSYQLISTYHPLLLISRKMKAILLFRKYISYIGKITCYRKY